jgi:hypothetical protein
MFSLLLRHLYVGLGLGIIFSISAEEATEYLNSLFGTLLRDFNYKCPKIAFFLRDLSIEYIQEIHKIYT